jgi:6-phosphogluconolactonase (cycloisomerase 2 family)
VLRALPVIASLLILAVIGGACGKGVFSGTSSGGSPTPTPSPGSGAFLYVTNTKDGKVSEFSRNTTTGKLKLIGTVKAGAAGGPVGITVDPSGKFLYVANSSDSSVHQFTINLTTGKLSAIGAGSAAAGTTPQQVAVTPEDNFAYATNFGTPSISGYSLNASTGALGTPPTSTSTGLAGPFGVLAATISAADFLYVSDNGATGQLLSYLITAGALGVPSSVHSLGPVVAVGTPGPLVIGLSNKFVYVTDLKLGVVSQFSTGVGPLSFVSSVATSSPGTPAVGLALATTPSSNLFLYVANQSANTVSIFSVNAVTGVLTLLGATSAILSAPTGVAVDPSGQFAYVTNQNSGTVTQFSIDSTTGALTLVQTKSTESPANAGSGPQFMAFAG